MNIYISLGITIILFGLYLLKSRNKIVNLLSLEVLIQGSIFNFIIFDNLYCNLCAEPACIIIMLVSSLEILALAYLLKKRIDLE